MFSVALSLLEFKEKKAVRKMSCIWTFLQRISIFQWNLLLVVNGTEIWAQGRDGVDGSVCWSQTGLGLQKAW